MGKVKGKHRLDKYYHLAKEQGFRSRASFKLIQLDTKYSLLHSSRSVLDLCAAPGGWMQVAVQRVPVGSLVIGVDLFPIRPIRGAISLEEDITKPKCRTSVKKLLGENGFKGFDLVLHDGSPNVGGNWAQEATSQNALVIESLKLATEFLTPKGNFLTKVFRSQDYNAVLYCLRQLFEKVEVTKPAASRSSSAEIYIVGLRYKAPAKVDPRLLDIKHLFQGVTEPQKVIDVLRTGKEKRQRGGYDDDAVLVRKDCAAADFVWSDSPLEVLGTVTSVSFNDPASLPIKDHALTTEEVKALCEDLRVLGKQDFKHLLKWRMNIRKALSSTQKTTTPTPEKENEGAEIEDSDEQDEDEKLIGEMEELTQAMDRKKKREKKLLAKRRAKDKSRKGTGMQVDALQDGYVDTELFALASVKGKKDLAALDTEEDAHDGEMADSEDNENPEVDENSEYSDLDSDEERKRYDDELDGILDDAYEQFVAKRDGSTKQRKRAKQSLTDGDLLEDNVDDDKEMDEPYDSDNDQGDEEANPLIVKDEREKTQEEIMQSWFSQDVFAKAVEEGDLIKDDSDDDLDVVDVGKKAIKSSKKPSPSMLEIAPKNKKSKKIDELEVVPAPATDSSDSSSSDDDSEGYDTDTKCEILATAKKMLNGGKRKREDMIDDAYNKYVFDDDRRGLPRWFVEDEKRHHQPNKPITKEEYAAIKAQMKEIDARPAKKVAQAKARKKRAVMRTMEKLRKKANSISDQSEIPDRSKRRMIDQLYKKATPKKPKKEYVVAKKGVPVKGGKGKVVVDRRMKKDARQHGMKTKGKGKDKGKGKGKGKGGKGKGSSKMAKKASAQRP